MGIDDKKASKFLDAINKYAQQQRNEIKNEAENFKKQELKKAQDEALKDAYKLIQKEMAQMKKKITKEHSKKEFERKKQLLDKRNQITLNVFKEAENELIKFTDSKDYKIFLQKLSKNLSNVISSSQEIYIYVKDKDLIYSEDIKKAFGKPCLVKTSNYILIGGLYAFDSNDGIIIDETLDTKLEMQKDWFKENSKLSVL